MIDLAIEMVITVIIFFIIAYAFVSIFGAPTCESAANQTAMNLKNAINEVVENRSSFDPGDPGSTEPDDPMYYTTVPIRLCQQKVPYAYILQFLGGMPEYQIYYEHFPEGGWLWNEAYPWSGGAGSTLLFWGVMRGAYGLGKLAGSMTTLYGGWKTINFLKFTKEVLEWKSAVGPGMVRGGTLMQGGWKLLWERLLVSLSPPKFIQSGRQLKNITDVVNEIGANYNIKAMGDSELANAQGDPDAGTLTYEAVGDKIVLKNQEIPLLISRTVPDGNGYKVETKKVYVRCDGCGGVLVPEQAEWDDVQEVDTSQTISDTNYVLLTVNPSQQMKDIYDSTKDSQPETAKQINEDFAFDNTGSFTSDNASNSSFMKRINAANEDRINTIKNYLESNSYNKDTADNEHTMQTSNEILWRVRAIENITNSPPNDVIGTYSGNQVFAQEFKDDILIPMLKYDDLYKIKDKIRSYASMYDIIISPEVKPEDAAKVLRAMWENEGGGVVFYNEGDLTNVFVRIKDALVNSNMAPLAVGDIVDKVKKLNNFDTYFGKYENNWGRITDIATDLQNIYNSIYSTLATQQEKYNNFSFELELYMIKNIVIELNKTNNSFYGVTDNDEIETMIENQLGMIIGLFKMSDNAAPITLWPRSPIKQIAEMVFMPVGSFLAPNSWLGKGLILTQMTQKCRGNSMCLYVQASQYEGPYYMDENVTKYTVRVWRPITWQQYAGLTAIEMHIPAHPRFYVVSPCFAVAKIWKTTYGGNPTVFVDPIRVNLHGEKSNYCYADTNLVNSYVEIWAAADAARVAAIILSWGVASGEIGVSEGIQKVAGVINKWVDPITLAQSIGEAAISWPGYPYSDLNYTDMQQGSKYFDEYAKLSEAIQSEYG